MDLVENSKQFEFLMNIKDVGMQIIFRKANPDMHEKLNQWLELIDTEDKELLEFQSKIT